MVFVWVYTHAVAHPNLVRMTDQALAALQLRTLFFQFVRQPLVVRIQKGQPLAARLFYAAIARRRNAAIMRQFNQVDGIAKLALHKSCGIVFGCIIDD